MFAENWGGEFYDENLWFDGSSEDGFRPVLY